MPPLLSVVLEWRLAVLVLPQPRPALRPLWTPWPQRRLRWPRPLRSAVAAVAPPSAAAPAGAAAIASAAAAPDGLDIRSPVLAAALVEGDPEAHLVALPERLIVSRGRRSLGSRGLWLRLFLLFFLLLLRLLVSKLMPQEVLPQARFLSIHILPAHLVSNKPHSCLNSSHSSKQ